MPEKPSAEKGIDRISTKLQSELDAILSRPFYPDDDLNAYLDASLSGVVELAGRAASEYQKRVSTELKGSHLEDTAQAYFDLPSIPTLIDLLISKQTAYSQVVDFLSSQHVVSDSTVYVPPQVDAGFQTGSGVGRREVHIENRLRSVLYLIHDTGIAFEDIEIRKGVVTDAMIRREPYIAISIPKLNRIVLVCDEKDNAAFIFDFSLLTAKGVQRDQLVLMDKIQLNALIDGEKRVGVRIMHRGTWLARMKAYLLQPIPTSHDEAEDGGESNLMPTVSRDRNDVWYGFYTDAEGKHWSTEKKIFEQIQLSPTHYAERFKEIFKPKPITDLRGRLRDGYCLEDIEASSLLAELRNRMFVDQEGEWRGFIAVDGLHWGTRGAIAQKVGLSKETVNKVVKKNEGKLVRRNIHSRTQDPVGYSYEEVVNLPEVQSLLEAKSPIQEGEWAGFWIDPETGNHWGVMTDIATKAGVSRHIIRVITKDAEKAGETISIRDNTGRAWAAFEYESIARRAEEHIAIPQVLSEGEWAGFHLDDSGRHWAHVLTLATYLKIGRKELRLMLKKKKFNTISLRSPQNNVYDAYCLEDLQAYMTSN